ncbi:MAG: DNA cytosine methyltransferase [Kiritimatiellales bacterium]|jgi:DNA (cytosine-5)-methyltransferase 1
MKYTVKTPKAPEHTHKRRLFVWPANPREVKESAVPYWSTNKQPAFISLFSGAMGLDLGLESAGLRNAGCLELDKWACKTIRKNKPELPLVEDDIRNWSGAELLKKFNVHKNDIQLVCGGPPCPSFSTAGRRQSFDDPRGEVMFDFLRIVDEIRPPFFIMENVRGILSAAIKHVPLAERSVKGKGLTAKEQKGSVLRLLKNEFEKMNYTVTVELVNAADYGVPQKRERVVFIGSRDGFQVAMPPPMFVSSGDMFTPRWRTLADALAGLHEEKPEITPFSESRKKYLRLLKEGQNWRNLPKDILPAAMGGAYTSGGGKVGFYRRLSFDRPSPTVSTSPGQKSTCLCHPTELRPLSVREYARIQQFPDDWIFEGSVAEKYRQIGNAVPVGLGHQIGRSVLKYLVNYEELPA